MILLWHKWVLREFFYEIIQHFSQEIRWESGPVCQNNSYLSTRHLIDTTWFLRATATVTFWVQENIVASQMLAKHKLLANTASTVPWSKEMETVCAPDQPIWTSSLSNSESYLVSYRGNSGLSPSHPALCAIVSSWVSGCHPPGR